MNYKLTLRDDVTVRDAIGTGRTLSFVNTRDRCLFTEDIATLEKLFKIEPIGMPFHVAIQETGKVRRMGWPEDQNISWCESDHCYNDQSDIEYVYPISGKDWIPVEDDKQ